VSYHLIQKGFDSGFIAIGTNIIISDASVLIEDSIIVKPFSFHFDVGSSMRHEVETGFFNLALCSKTGENLMTQRLIVA